MSYETRTFTLQAIFCDVPGCNERAFGPCVGCDQDVCKPHGEPEQMSVNKAGVMVLICPRCVESLTLRPFVVRLRLAGERWDKFHLKQARKNRVENDP